MRIKALASSVLAFLLVSCSTPVEPTSSTTLDRFVVALRQQDAMIVLYVGCAADIVEALQKTVGPPIALGGTPCDLGR
ncbi:MAG: hypothetical protein LC753_12445 [Acidobacteria bacterium]|nr:hypothetical protein [Acidobacteriota bacterium]